MGTGGLIALVIQLPPLGMEGGMDWDKRVVGLVPVPSSA
jgi:hypothetical protein